MPVSAWPLAIFLTPCFVFFLKFKNKKLQYCILHTVASYKDSFISRVRTFCKIRREPDFFGWYFIKLEEGKYKKTTLNQAFIDYLRYAYGRSDVENHLDLFKSKREDCYIEPAVNPQIQTLDGIDHLMDKLPPVERACIHLYFIWGLSLFEISQCFGTSESYVSYLKKRALKRLKS